MPTIHGHAISRNNVRATSEYTSWLSAKARCFYPKEIGFHRYGGRGITMCPEWAASFPAFLAHLGLKPTPRHSLDRIDPNGNYEPGNVRWASPREQALNRRQRTHCKRGHLLSVENLHTQGDGRRRCLKCTQERQRQRIAKRSAERADRRDRKTGRITKQVIG